MSFSISHSLKQDEFYFRNVLAGIIAFGIGCGNSNVPDVFASIQNALCFIDYDIKCKHNKDFITHIDYEKDCSTWYEDTIQELKAQPQVKIIKRYLKRTEALETTCKELPEYDIADLGGRQEGVSVQCVPPKK